MKSLMSGVLSSMIVIYRLSRNSIISTTLHLTDNNEWNNLFGYIAFQDEIVSTETGTKDGNGDNQK